MPSDLKPKYRVLINPTGENYGVTGSAKLFTEAEALQTFLTFVDHLEERGTAKGYVLMDDEPQFGGESSDVLLRKYKGKRVRGFDQWLGLFADHLTATRHGTSAYTPLQSVPTTAPTLNDYSIEVLPDGVINLTLDGYYTIHAVEHDRDGQTHLTFHKEDL
jgi:hypothetical protein